MQDLVYTEKFGFIPRKQAEQKLAYKKKPRETIEDFRVMKCRKGKTMRGISK